MLESLEKDWEMDVERISPISMDLTMMESGLMISLRETVLWKIIKILKSLVSFKMEILIKTFKSVSGTKMDPFIKDRLKMEKNMDKDSL